MRTGRPRTPIGTHGAINTRREGGRVVAETRVRDLDGRLRQVRATGPTAAAARVRLLERIRERPSLPSAGALGPTSSFADLADLWLADLELRALAGNTKENYRTCLRLHVRPAFEHYTLAEVTTGRVEWFLAKQAKVSASQAKQARTLPASASALAPGAATADCGRGVNAAGTFGNGRVRVVGAMASSGFPSRGEATRTPALTSRPRAA